ncbi:thioredoxin-like protein AAED1, chloroplastic isoform X6 [Quercus suber]|uniref:thioredoxin-like protein AAED1, chloroplastic isoform X6 n=1 Tax=Quercus suber TaxID=58331 RepID=UPI000CE170B9|nr:thioredoxin-like protein AAED1, chloroplastic isoform X2 [Quercus suber]
MALIAIPPQPTTLQNLPPRLFTAPPSKFSLTSPPTPNASSTSTVTYSYYPTKSANSVSVSNTTSTSRRSSLVVRASTSPFSPNIADTLGDVNIFTAAGDPVFFKDLWDQNQGIAVVALLRHFGCPCCWELASSLKEAKPKFDAAGVKLVAIGVGTPNKARILADRAKVFSRFEALQKAVKNYTVEATPDDRSSVLQQGGMFVFKGKQLLYARKDEGTGDHAPLDDIFEVCCKVPVA